MRTVSQITKHCGTNRENITRAAKRLGIVPSKKTGRTIYFDEYQEFLIIEHLFYTGKTQFLIFESKMNIPEVEESFTDFKLRTYGKK